MNWQHSDKMKKEHLVGGLIILSLCASTSLSFSIASGIVSWFGRFRAGFHRMIWGRSRQQRISPLNRRLRLNARSSTFLDEGPESNPYNPDFWTSSSGGSRRREKSFDEFEERQTDNANCYVQTCDQSITGRMLSYNRALEIVQDEEYLTAADLDIIRRQSNAQVRSSRRKSRYLKEISKHGCISEMIGSVWFHRLKRQTAGSGGLLDLFGDPSLSQEDWWVFFLHFPDCNLASGL